MNLISRDELKEKLDRGDDFKLVMVLGDWAFQAKHIPGSINVSRIQDAVRTLDVDDEIVVYCSDEACVASQAAYRLLERRGYKNFRRYAGGLSDWEDAGYPLEGEMVAAT
jgi:rhodanese-related sulfurtransferase